MSAEPAAGGRRRPRVVAVTAAAVGVVVLGLVWLLATRPAAGTRLADSRLLGELVPVVEAETIDGGAYTLAQDRGRWVLVNFFATWCVPCRQEHDDLVRFSARHAAAGDATVVGVVYSDSVAAVSDFRRQEGGDWPMLTDPEGRVALDFGVAGVPESYLVSPSGVVVAKIVGGVTFEALEDLLVRAQAAAGGALAPGSGPGA